MLEDTQWETLREILMELKYAMVKLTQNWELLNYDDANELIDILARLKKPILTQANSVYRMNNGDQDDSVEKR